jgi:type I restriction enzyme, S subunit
MMNNRKMKDSGVEWIGEIPENWEMKKIGNIYYPRNEKVSDKDYPALSVTMQGILSQLETAAKTDNGDCRKLVKKGDFAINSRSDRRGSCGVSPCDGSVSLINTILCPREKMNSSFYNWLFHTSMFSDEFYKWGHGIVDDLWTTRWQEMKNISIIYPPLSEQRAIASFLDSKCAEIDSLISLQETMISELQAYKQSVITEAVTKGLDKNVEMKDSGVEWIGEIPKKWKVCTLKNITKNGLQYGANENGLFFDESLPRYVRITDIFENKLREDIQKQSLSEETAKPYILKDNDILFARSGGTVGKSFIYKERYGRCAFAGYLIRATINSSNSADYIYYYTESSCYAEWKSRIFIQATIQNIGADKYSMMELPLPSLSEQHSIATYLDSKCSEIDSLISIKQQKITELKEYKKSVIFEYVTGEKQV